MKSEILVNGIYRRMAKIRIIGSASRPRKYNYLIISVYYNLAPVLLLKKLASIV